MSEYTFLYINHFLLKLTACFFFLATVFTKHCWYCSQKFLSYALSCLHLASSHYYIKLHMCIWLWCVAKDCPWLSNSTLIVILIWLNMYWGLIDGDGQQVPCHGSGACSEYLKEQGLLGRNRHNWEYNIKMDLRIRVERCGRLDSFCSGQWLVWALYEQSNECRKFLE